tara:strand:+ start:712 stop:1638 length:927 start_codon:yes stop_codon:yes gene_type:complete
MAATLNEQTIHCAKTGISLVNISDSEGIITLNALLTAGKLMAGCHNGNIFLSEDERAKLLAAKQWNGSHYRWAWRSKTGDWVQYEGWTIGQHNDAVLKDAGIESDKATRSKGQVRNRQYVPIGTTGKPAPKEPITTAALSGPLFGGSNSPKETVQASPKETVNSTPKGKAHQDIWPKPDIEFGKQGGFQIYVSRMVAEFKLTKGQGKALWAEGRRVCAQRAKGNLEAMLQDPSALLRSKKMSMSRESRTLIYWDQPKAETVAAPKEPKAQGSEGTTVMVKPEALAAFLSGMEGAVIVGFAGGNAIVAL